MLILCAKCFFELFFQKIGRLWKIVHLYELYITFRQNYGWLLRRVFPKKNFPSLIFLRDPFPCSILPALHNESHVPMRVQRALNISLGSNFTSMIDMYIIWSTDFFDGADESIRSIRLTRARLLYGLYIFTDVGYTNGSYAEFKYTFRLDKINFIRDNLLVQLELKNRLELHIHIPAYPVVDIYCATAPTNVYVC